MQPNSDSQGRTEGTVTLAWHLLLSKPIFRWGVGIAIVLALVGTLVAIPYYQVERDYRNGLLKKEEIPKQVNEYRQTVIQIIGGLVVGLYLTWRQTRATEESVGVAQENLITAQEGQIAERFSRGIEHLGNINETICLGGIYTLEGVAKDSEKEHWTVMQVLSAYVRVNTANSGEPKEEKTAQIDPNIQAILTIIGKREKNRPEGVIDLHRTSLPGANLQGANLQGANLHGANLQGADLQEANLRGADLRGANLQGADLRESDLREANLREANLRGAKLERANLQRANLLEARNLTVEQLRATYAESFEDALEDTLIDKLLERQLPTEDDRRSS